MPGYFPASPSRTKRSLGVNPVQGRWTSAASSAALALAGDCGSCFSSWLPCRIVRQSSQGLPNTASMSELELVEAICDHVANCITPQWPPTTQKMKRNVRSRPDWKNTMGKYFIINTCGQGQAQRAFQCADREDCLGRAEWRGSCRTGLGHCQQDTPWWLVPAGPEGGGWQDCRCLPFTGNVGQRLPRAYRMECPGQRCHGYFQHGGKAYRGIPADPGACPPVAEALPAFIAGKNP